MGLNLGRIGAGIATGGLSEVYRALRPGGSQQGYAPLPFENPNIAVDNKRIEAEFMRTLGRSPTQNEMEQYSRYIKTGDLSYGEIGQIIESLPEQLRTRLAGQQQEFGGMLAANDQGILDKAAATAQSRFSSLGRGVTSAQVGALAQVGQNLATQRQSALANFYGQNMNTLNSAYDATGRGALHRAYNLQDSRTAFNRGLLGYQTQRNDFNTDLANEDLRRKQQAYKTLPFTLGGAAVGGALGGGRGAGVGANLGTQIGGLF